MAEDDGHRHNVDSMCHIPSNRGECSTISRILRYCKRRILFPYLKLLGVMGLKPWTEDDTCGVFRFLNKLWVIFVVVLLLTGYTLQFITCFRRDYGFDYSPEDPFYNPSNDHSRHFDVINASHLINKEISISSNNSNNSNLSHTGHHRRHKINLTSTTLPSQTQPSMLETQSDPSLRMDASTQMAVKQEILYHSICAGNAFYVHLIPSFLHFIAFSYMLCLYWLNHDEQLQNLMERVFIQATQAHSAYFAQKRVLRTLKFLVFFGTLWLMCSMGCMIFQIVFSHIRLNFWPQLGELETRALASVMAFSAVWQDAIQVTVIISYCIHCHLLSIYMEFIHNRISQHSITLLECIKEIGEIEKLLRYLNSELACGVMPLLILDSMFSIGSVTFLVGRYPETKPYTMLTACFACIQWILLVVLPLVQGAKLNSSLKKARELGHIVRMRPFGYQNYQQQDLDSFLLFVSTMKMDVRVMKLPLTASNLSILFFLVIFVIFIWGYFQ